MAPSAARACGRLEQTQALARPAPVCKRCSNIWWGARFNAGPGLASQRTFGCQEPLSGGEGARTRGKKVELARIEVANGYAGYRAWCADAVEHVLLAMRAPGYFSHHG